MTAIRAFIKARPIVSGVIIGAAFGMLVWPMLLSVVF